MKFLKMLSVCSAYWILGIIGSLLWVPVFKFQNHVPPILLHLFDYGKAQKTAEKNARLLVSKRLFSHFYLCGVISFTVLLVLSLYVAIANKQLPEIVTVLLDLLRYPGTDNLGHPFSNLLLLICCDIQVIRRYIECLFISVYNPSEKMSIVFFLIGMTFYPAVGISSLSGTEFSQKFSLSDFLTCIQPHHAIGLMVFSWAANQQHAVAQQLAKLRKNKSGEVTNTQHHIPHGGMFEYISCPHFLMEILIYLSFSLMSGFQNTKLLWTFFFVLVNQSVVGYLTHQWYKRTFKSYPSTRRAVFPYLF